MRHVPHRLAAALALLLSVAPACAMSAPTPPIRCTVEGAKALDPASGGEEALCAMIRESLAGSDVVAVDITVERGSRLSAIATLSDGRLLPEVNAARSDAPAGKRTFEHLASGLKDQAESLSRR